MASESGVERTLDELATLDGATGGTSGVTSEPPKWPGMPPGPRGGVGKCEKNDWPGKFTPNGSALGSELNG